MKIGQRFLLLLKKIFVTPEKKLIELMIIEPCAFFSVVCSAFRPRDWLGLLEDYHLKGIRLGCVAILIGFTFYYGSMLQIIWARKERGNRWPSVCYIALAYGMCVLFTWISFISGTM